MAQARQTLRKAESGELAAASCSGPSECGRAATRREFVQVLASLGVLALGGGAAGLLSGCPRAAGGSSPSASQGHNAEPAAAQDDGSAPAEPASHTFFALDTAITLKGYCDERLLVAAAERCEYLESLFSRTIEDSDIGRLNRSAGQPVAVAPETADLIGKALRYCEESGGRFDISIGAVSTLWDFKAGVVPSSQAIAEALPHVDYRNIVVDGTTVTLRDPEAKLDLGGIAKGYITDDLAAFLKEGGCESAFLNLGGNVRVIGSKPNGKPWRVGIQNPNLENSQPIAFVDCESASVVTSGTYERQFEREGRRYWHILDPQTGYPVETELESASILAGESLDGDGFTKPVFMMAPDEGLAWLEDKGLQGIIVTRAGAVFHTSDSRIRVLDE